MSFSKNFQNLVDYYYVVRTGPIEIGGNSSYITYNLFTWAIANRTFSPTKMTFVLTGKRNNSYGTSPTCQIGTNDTGVNTTRFNNWVASSASTLSFTTITTVGQYQTGITLIAGAGIPVLTNGTTVKMNVTAVGTANAYCTIEMFVEGFMIPV